MCRWIVHCTSDRIEIHARLMRCNVLMRCIKASWRYTAISALSVEAKSVPSSSRTPATGQERALGVYVAKVVAIAA